MVNLSLSYDWNWNSIRMCRFFFANWRIFVRFTGLDWPQHKKKKELDWRWYEDGAWFATQSQNKILDHRFFYLFSSFTHEFLMKYFRKQLKKHKSIQQKHLLYLIALSSIFVWKFTKSETFLHFWADCRTFDKAVCAETFRDNDNDDEKQHRLTIIMLIVYHNTISCEKTVWEKEKKYEWINEAMCFDIVVFFLHPTFGAPRIILRCSMWQRI